MSLAALFEERYIPEPNSGCFIWLGIQYTKKRYGYGGLNYRGKQYRAHRVSYELFKGAVPDDKCVLHRCDTPICVNPDHLYLGDRAANGADMRRRGRSCSGEKHWKFSTGKHVGRYARRSKTIERRNRSNDHLL